MTANRIGIRIEDKSEWERRAPLTPDAVRDLSSRGIEVRVQRSARRTFPDAAYAKAGAILDDDVGDCEIVLGIKEMPRDVFRSGGAYVFFSHTIKGQSYNMDMLRSLVDLDGAGLPDPIWRSVILWQGAFPPDFEHMSQFLS